MTIEKGKPGQILDTTKGKGDKVEVKMQHLASQEIGNQNITGWVVMPPDHWEDIKKTLLDFEAWKKEKANAPEKR